MTAGGIRQFIRQYQPLHGESRISPTYHGVRSRARSMSVMQLFTTRFNKCLSVVGIGRFGPSGAPYPPNYPSVNEL